MWFVFALLTTVIWGLADLFYKKGADTNDKYSHLKISVIVGLIMGIHAIFTIITGNINYDFKNIIIYLPVSAMYILSMSIGYFGLKYLELSIASPVQNSSGAITCILCYIVLGQKINLLSTIAVSLVCIGVIALGIIEKSLEGNIECNRKYQVGFFAFLMPVLYSVFDALGTFFDVYYLDDFNTTPLVNVSEDTLEVVANTSYELTFLIIAIILFVYIKFVKKQDFKPLLQGNKVIAGILETVGQFFYVFAMSGNGIIAAPMIASYCIVSILLSRIFLKEKLTKLQYTAIIIAILGIVLMGLSDGLSGSV